MLSGTAQQIRQVQIGPTIGTYLSRQGDVDLDLDLLHLENYFSLWFIQITNSVPTEDWVVVRRRLPLRLGIVGSVSELIRLVASPSGNSLSVVTTTKGVATVGSGGGRTAACRTQSSTHGTRNDMNIVCLNTPCSSQFFP